MPSPDRIPVFSNYINYIKHHNMDLKPAPTKTFVTQVHLTLECPLKKKSHCFNSKENQQSSSVNPLEREEDHSSTKILGSYNAELISSILSSQIIDKNELEDNDLLFSLHSGTEPTLWHIQQSLADRTSLGISREFTRLPSTLEIQKPVDMKIIHRKILYPTEEKQVMHMNKGFSSITITARRNIASLKHALKEIASDPAPSIFKNIDLLMKIPISSVERDQHCRYLDGQEWSIQSCTSHRIFNCKRGWRTVLISNAKLNTEGGNKKAPFFISYVHAQVNQACPGVIYYVDRSFSLPIGNVHVADQATYCSTLSFQIKYHSSKVVSTNRKNILKTQRLDGIRVDKASLKMESQQRQANYQPHIIKSTSLKDLPDTFHHLKCEKNYEAPVDQPDGHNHGLCKDILNCLNTKASSVGVRKEEQIPISNIYSHKNDPPNYFSALGAERSNITRFNFIFGRQISKLDKEKQKLHKENLPPNGSKQVIDIYSAEHMSITSETKNNIVFYQPGQINENKDILPAMMSLRDALEHRRPDFITNSKERLRKLELMVHRRKFQQGQESPNGKPQKFLPKPTSIRRKIFTVPHPLSDNLFKPKERTISEQEMQKRSKRIYNSLPEVKKKKEEEEKRMITLNNRMRAELFKKKLLDQVLQRNTA
ncbi:(E2-independent) E3 ubiquitin-conjugating enzyme FATS [Spea bombifrons]|uniref:(E2-independent) E3 ubiquitin-conjugating enzyme FATS n=1 Tax=Spea bombifrons TaxID=233779 RepID=UPI002349FCCB|nr:(E2-independent) E3 ubiquitin-conjugating enzyme FATS [Spea bombifrons]